MQDILALPSRDLTCSDINGEPLSFVGPTVLPQLVVRNLDSFFAGNLHNHLDFWQNLIFSAGKSCPKVSLPQIIREGVKFYDFFRHFKGNFKGRRYDAAVPPVCVYPKLPRPRQFCVLLDHLPDLPRYVLLGHFQTAFDGKNGYQHLKIHPVSQGFFSFSWKSYYFSFCTLPFGWKASVFLYHNFGLVVTSAARSLDVPVSQYIDDRHVGQLFSSGLADYQPCGQLTLAPAFILLSLRRTNSKRQVKNS